MIKNEELEKLRIRANQAVEDSRKGLKITLAMDPVVLFAMAVELLRLRRLHEALQVAVDGGERAKEE
jgi:hypothetical protein